MGGQEGDDGAFAAVSTAATTSGRVVDEDLPSLGAVSAPSNRGLAGLAFSHVKVEEFASMPGDPDDDDVEPTMTTPLVSLGYARDGTDFEHEDPEIYGGGTTSDPTFDHGDLDPTSRARDLISRDLLDELSHEPTNWNETRHPPTPPHGGFDTPSEPGTPRATQSQQYYHTQGNEGLSCLDQWDWKTDAPEFVPGSLKGMLGHTDSQVVGTPFSQAGVWAMQSGQAVGSASGGGMNAGIDDIGRLSELRGNYEWQLRSKSEDLRDMQQRMSQLDIETAQVRASWEVERRGLMRQIGHYRAVLERYCIPVDDSGTGYSMQDPHGQYFPVFEPSAPSQWATENTSVRVPSATVRPANSSGVAFTTAPARQVPLGNDSRQLRAVGPSAATAPAIAKRSCDGEQAKSSLDSKMRQLNSLLREDNTSAQSDRQPSPDSSGHDNDPAQGGGNNYTGSSIASTLRAMFPHATIRTKTTPGENGEDDEDDALENELGVPASETGLAARQPICPQSHASEDERDAFVSSESDGAVDAKARERSKEVDNAVQQADLGGVASRRSSAGSKSWADLEDGDDDDKEAWEKDNDVWTPELVDRVARKGFELRRRGEQWELKIFMSQLEPPLTETGMERYCRWLRTRLTSFREEHGQDALWCCRGEVDFSHNQMSNQMVWMLLETLAQHEVHTALLKIYSNRISQGGVLAICEFIRQNERPEALQELHLSHNEIDDESALELLRTLKSQRPRYPPQRSAERSGNLVHVPVWLRLSHNRIRDPARVLRVAEEEGVNVCTAWDRQVCGTSKCVRQDCPIAHLYAFTVQDAPKQEKHNENGDGGRRHQARRENDQASKGTHNEGSG